MFNLKLTNMSYNEWDADRDREIIENHGEWGTSYCNDRWRDFDCENAQDRLDAYESGEYDD